MATEELAITVRAKDFATGVFAKIGNSIKGVASHVFSLKGALATAAGGFGAIQAVERAGAVENIDTAFRNLTKTIGGSEAILGALRRATQGTVSDFELMITANKSILLGVGQSAEEFELLAETAAKLGKAVGRSATEAFADLSIGIGRQSRMILDNLGIIVKVEEANEAYAAQLGKTVSQLTDAEKRTAFMNATMDAARKKVADLGAQTDSLSNSWGRLKSSIANLADEFLRLMGPQIKAVFDWMNKNLASLRPKILDFSADVVEALANITEGMERAAPLWNVTVGALNRLAGELTRAAQRLIDVSEWSGKQADWLMGRKGLEQQAIRTDSATKKIAASLRDFARDIRESNATAELEKLSESLDLFYGYAEDAAQKKRDLESLWQGPVLAEWQGPKLPDREFQYKYREQFAWMKKAYDEFARTDVATGAAHAFSELQRRSTEWGKTTYEWAMNVSGAIGTNLADGLVEIGFNFREAGRIAKEFSIGLLKDLARITMQLAIMQGVQAGLGALGGALFPGSTMQPFSFHQHGGYIPRNELAVVGEAGPELVALPGGSRVFPNSALGGSVNVTIHNHNPQFRTEEQERRFTRMEQEQIRAIVVDANRSSTGFRDGMS